MLLGPQFHKDAFSDLSELVPISILKKMRYFDSVTASPELVESIKTEGFNRPGRIQYYQKDRTASLWEGHHRLDAAEKAGFTHMPVYVERLNTSGGGVPVRGFTPNKDNYVPGHLRPSDIMDISEEDK